MGIRCRHCSRHFESEEGLEGHDCSGENVTILVQRPGSAKGNPAMVFESRDDAMNLRDELGDSQARVIDAPLVPPGGFDDEG